MNITEGTPEKERRQRGGWDGGFDLSLHQDTPDQRDEDGGSDMETESPTSSSVGVPQGEKKRGREVDDDQSPGTSLARRRKTRGKIKVKETDGVPDLCSTQNNTDFRSGAMEGAPRLQIKRPWTDEEKTAARKHSAGFMEHLRVPGKEDNRIEHQREVSHKLYQRQEPVMFNLCNQCREKEREMERDTESEREMERDTEIEKDRERDTERETEIGKARVGEKKGRGDSEKMGERERQTEIVRKRERKERRQREKMGERERGRRRERENGRGRQRERKREKKETERNWERERETETD